MDPTIDQFNQRATRFTQILDGVDGRWDAPTPCAPWTVADVVDHAIGTQRDFFAQHHLDVGPPPAAADPAAAWRTHLAAANAVLAADAVAATAYDGYFGPTTIGATMADFYGWDLVIHGWDIAVATGQTWHLDDAEASALERTADGWGEALRAPGVCGPAVVPPAEATAGERLLARLGRDPRWAPPVSA